MPQFLTADGGRLTVDQFLRVFKDTAGRRCCVDCSTPEQKMETLQLCVDLGLPLGTATGNRYTDALNSGRRIDMEYPYPSWDEICGMVCCYTTYKNWGDDDVVIPFEILPTVQDEPVFEESEFSGMLEDLYKGGAR